MAVYKKILELQRRVKGITRDGQAYNYKYVTGDKLLDIVRPIMDELGLLLMPQVTQHDLVPQTYKAGNQEKTEVLHKIRMNMRWVDAETGETVDIPWTTCGMNQFDKGYGSALTYGERYYLLKTLHISTSKDDVDEVSIHRDEILAYEPLDDVTYNKIIALYVKGVKAKSGKDYKAEWAERTHAGQAELAKFDVDVDSYVNENINNNSN